MADENLQAECDRAIIAGDTATLERVGPILFPEDGAAPSPPAPPAGATPDAPRPAVEFGRRHQELLVEMGQVHPGSPRARALEAELEAVLKAQYGEDGGPAPGMPADLATLADRVSFPAGTDEGVRAGMLSLTAAENLPAPRVEAVIREIHTAPRMPLADARRALAAEYGDRLPTVLRRADEIHETLPPALQEAIKQADLFGSPVVIRRLLELGEWRQRGRRAQEGH